VNRLDFSDVRGQDAAICTLVHGVATGKGVLLTGPSTTNKTKTLPPSASTAELRAQIGGAS
jgi:predicted ATPase with chaperone activity